MPTASDVIVANMALSHIGASQITALSDDNGPAEACNLWIEWARAFTLTRRHWNFAQKRARLALHPHPQPEIEWAYRYLYPSDALRIRRLLMPGGRGGTAVPFAVEEGDVDVVAEPNFDDDDAWTAGSGWEIGAGVATGTLASADLAQTIPTKLTEGATYTLTFTMTRSAGSVVPKVGGTSGTSRSTAGTFSEDIVAGATDILAFTGTGFTGTLDAVSLAPAASKVVLTDLEDAMALYTCDMQTYARFSPLFVEAWSYALAHAIAYQITGKNSIKDRMMQDFREKLREAAAAEGNEGNEGELRDADWITGRA